MQNYYEFLSLVPSMQVIFLNSGMDSLDIGKIITHSWPPKNILVLRRKRLFATGLCVAFTVLTYELQLIDSAVLSHRPARPGPRAPPNRGGPAKPRA